MSAYSYEYMDYTIEVNVTIYNDQFDIQMYLLTLILLEPGVTSLCHQYSQASLHICAV